LQGGIWGERGTIVHVLDLFSAQLSLLCIWKIKVLRSKSLAKRRGSYVMGFVKYVPPLPQLQTVCDHATYTMQLRHC
jgi:hypothetical protein